MTQNNLIFYSCNKMWRKGGKDKFLWPPTACRSYGVSLSNENFRNFSHKKEKNGLKKKEIIPSEFKKKNLYKYNQIYRNIILTELYCQLYNKNAQPDVFRHTVALFILICKGENCSNWSLNNKSLYSKYMIYLFFSNMSFWCHFSRYIWSWSWSFDQKRETREIFKAISEIIKTFTLVCVFLSRSLTSLRIFSRSDDDVGHCRNILCLFCEKNETKCFPSFMVNNEITCGTLKILENEMKMKKKIWTLFIFTR